MASRKSEKPTAGDIAEVAAGKGSASDKREVANYRALGRKRAKATNRKR